MALGSAIFTEKYPLTEVYQMQAEICPCGSTKLYHDCCEPFIAGSLVAASAEQLMRSRYSAYAKVQVPYLIQTTHPTKRADFKAEDIEQWAKNNQWQQLSVLSTQKGSVNDSTGEVEFKAFFIDENRIKRVHYEYSYFVKEEHQWFYLYGTYQPKAIAKIDRNANCPCGSGKKYKKCCGK